MMERIYKLQRAMATIYAVLAIALVVYALWFMTDFKDLFGLQLRMNLPIAEFHDVQLQNFNHMIFFSSLFLVAAIFLEYALEIWSKIPDIFAIVVLCAVLVFGLCFCGYSIMELSSLEAVYSSLDYSGVYMEGGIEYIVNYRAFNIGMILYSLSALSFAVFALSLFLSHVTYRKEVRR